MLCATSHKQTDYTLSKLVIVRVPCVALIAEGSRR